MNISLFLRDFLKSWKSSLEFFLPPFGKTFFLINLKTILETYKILFIQLWPLLIVAAVMHFVYMWLCIPSAMGCFFLWLCAHVIDMLLVFLLFLIIRPSIKPKSYEYYKDYIPHFLLFLATTFLLSLINNKFYLISPGVVFYYLFVLDTPLTLKNSALNAWRALKMVIFGFPYCLTVWLCFVLLITLCMFILALPLFMFLQKFDAVEYAAHFVFILLLPVIYSWYCNFYIKRIRDQYNLFF